jgi:hypothetical protein
MSALRSAFNETQDVAIVNFTVPVLVYAKLLQEEVTPWSYFGTDLSVSLAKLSSHA